MEGRSQDGEREEPGDQWEPGEWRGVWSAVGTWWVRLLAQKGEVNLPHFFFLLGSEPHTPHQLILVLSTPVPSSQYPWSPL